MTQQERFIVLDISSHTRPFDYFKFKAQHPEIRGVILRCGFTGWGRDKSKNIDAEFERHYLGFKRIGLPIGVYYYSCAVTTAEAIEEARLTISIIKNKQLDYPVYFDTENDHDIREAGASQVSQAMLPPKQLTDIVIAYCSLIEDAGYYTGIYASASWFRDRLELGRLLRFDKWVAHYGVNKPSVTFKYGMHQFTKTARVEGHRGYVDLNWCTRDYPAIIKRAGLNGYPKVPEPEIEEDNRIQNHLQIALDNLSSAMQLLEEKRSK